MDEEGAAFRKFIKMCLAPEGARRVGRVEWSGPEEKWLLWKVQGQEEIPDPNLYNRHKSPCRNRGRNQNYCL